MKALFRTRTGDPLLTIKFGTVAVGCQRLPIGLFEPLSPVSDLRPAATGCDRLAPLMLHSYAGINERDCY